MSRFEISTATAADVDAVLAFADTHVRGFYADLVDGDYADGIVHDWWEPTAMGRAIERGDVLLAIDEGQLIGVAEISVGMEPPVVWKLYVDAARRGRGIGRRLLEAIVDRASTRSRVALEHVAANIRAAAFYEREGFVVDRIDVDPAGDRRRDVVWRSKPLS